MDRVILKPLMCQVVDGLLKILWKFHQSKKSEPAEVGRQGGNCAPPLFHLGSYRRNLVPSDNILLLIDLPSPPTLPIFRRLWK